MSKYEQRVVSLRAWSINTSGVYKDAPVCRHGQCSEHLRFWISSLKLTSQEGIHRSTLSCHHLEQWIHPPAAIDEFSPAAGQLGRLRHRGSARPLSTTRLAAFCLKDLLEDSSDIGSKRPLDEQLPIASSHMEATRSETPESFGGER